MHEVSLSSQILLFSCYRSLYPPCFVLETNRMMCFNPQTPRLFLFFLSFKINVVHLWTNMVIFYKSIMSKEELRTYRLNSMEEPTDEMLEAIMLGVQEHARQSTIRAKAELDRRFSEMVEQMRLFKASLNKESTYA